MFMTKMCSLSMIVYRCPMTQRAYGDNIVSGTRVFD